MSNKRIKKKRTFQKPPLLCKTTFEDFIHNGAANLLRDLYNRDTTVQGFKKVYGDKTMLMMVQHLRSFCDLQIHYITKEDNPPRADGEKNEDL